MRMFQRLALLCALTFFSAYAYAVAQGFYLGVAMGPATNTAGNQTLQLYKCTNPALCGPCSGGCAVQGTGPNGEIFDFSTRPAKPSSKQWGSRFFMGYMFNPYAGVDFGFNFFNGISYDSPPPPAGYKTCGSASVRVRDVDLSGKFAMPIKWFDVYFKAGIALTYQTVSGGLAAPQTKTAICSNCNGTNCPIPSCPSGEGTTTGTTKTYTACGDSTYITKFNPIFSIGASYDITQSWVVDFSYTKLMTSGPANSIEFMALGIAYHFVDVYCGQFLCDD